MIHIYTWHDSGDGNGVHFNIIDIINCTNWLQWFNIKWIDFYLCFMFHYRNKTKHTCTHKNNNVDDITIYGLETKELENGGNRISSSLAIHSPLAFKNIIFHQIFFHSILTIFFIPSTMWFWWYYLTTATLNPSSSPFPCQLALRRLYWRGCLNVE